MFLKCNYDIIIRGLNLRLNSFLNSYWLKKFFTSAADIMLTVLNVE